LRILGRRHADIDQCSKRCRTEHVHPMVVDRACDACGAGGIDRSLVERDL
jgi:hypothetical protein